MNHAKVKPQYPINSNPEQTSIDRILQKLSRLELPAKEHFESYTRHKWRLNHKRSTLQGSFASVKLFLELYGKSGKRDLSKMERVAGLNVSFKGVILRVLSRDSRKGKQQRRKMRKVR